MSALRLESNGVNCVLMAKHGNVCPECGHEFQGNGWDGIDAHWRSRHNSAMRYEEAWPLIQSGEYQRLSKHPREDSSQAAARIVRQATEDR
jgi:hypothetical protein